LMPRRLRTGGRKASPPEGIAPREIGHAQDVVALFPAANAPGRKEEPKA